MSARTPSAWAVLALAAALLPAAAEEAGESDPVFVAAGDTAGLAALEGAKITVYGETGDSGKSATGTNFVNFAGAEFYLVTFKSDLDQFEDGEPADIYDGKRLAVDGVLAIHLGKPQIKLTSPGQVRILEPDEVFPPPAPDPAAVSVAAADSAAGEAGGASGPEGDAEEDGAEPETRRPPVDPSEYFQMGPAPQ